MSWRKFLPLAVLLVAAATLSARSEDSDVNPLEGLQVLKGDGVGTATAPSSLTHVSLGVVKGTVFGVANFKASFNDDPWSFGGNGSGGSCVRGSGSISLTMRNGSTITMQQAGLSCNTSADSTLLTDNATYLVVEGTGPYAGATGTGHVVTGVAKGKVTIHFDGNILLQPVESEEDRAKSETESRQTVLQRAGEPGDDYLESPLFLDKSADFVKEDRE